MGHALYNVPVIPQGLRHEETIHHIADALDYLNDVVDDIMSRITNRISENKTKLQQLNRRTAVAKAKIEKLTGSNKATKVFSSAKYPAKDLHKDYVSLYKKPATTEFKINQEIIHGKREAMSSENSPNKILFHHDKLESKIKYNLETNIEEGLGSLPPNLDSVSSLLLFNTSENPYKRYVLIDPLGAVTKTRQSLEEEIGTNLMDDAPMSISQHDRLEARMGDNFFYSPGMGDVPDIDVPLDLPDLPGIADDLRYSMDSGPMIAPSATTTPAIPELPNLVPESPTPTTVNSPEAAVKPTSDIVIEDVKLPAVIPPVLQVPIPPPIPMPPSIPEGFVPPPPPPLPPVLAPSSEPGPSAPKVNRPTAPAVDSRAVLMDAIRQAGGSAKLKSVKDRKVEAKKKKQEEKDQGGGDLMADLHATLSMRRRAISRADRNMEGAMERISSMIPPPPIKESANSTSATEDDEDWD